MACAVQRALLPSDEVVAQSQAGQDIETKKACAAHGFAACINALDREAVGMVEAKTDGPVNFSSFNSSFSIGSKFLTRTSDMDG